MNKRIKLTIGIGLAVLLLTAVFATAAFAQGPGGAFGGMMGGRGAGGMMGGQGYGPGMMNGQGYGPGMMGGQGYGPGMMGGRGAPANGSPISMDQAVAAAQQYVAAYNNADLKLSEVMEFDNNFYALVTEKSTGTGAFELLVNRNTGAVHPEPGPNMMWNTKYGHMGIASGMMGRVGGMMGGAWNQQSGPMTVTVAQARTIAQQWLDANQPGAQLADDEMQFYGYYTMDFLKDGKTAGMLSVNGYSGQVWYHTWHGSFISEQTF
jgi:hypothetical protein